MWRLVPVCLGMVLLCAGSAPGAAQVASATQDLFVISVGDELELDILDDSDAPQRFIVGRDGAVQLPYIGGLQVAATTIRDARENVRRAYIDRQIFVDPRIELSIASFRPVSVLGDVRTPGNYAFQPFMTAEQAVGLAGGVTVSVTNEEARVLELRNLEGTLGRLEFDLALAAAKFARVQAQLAGEQEVSLNNLPADLRPWINKSLFDEHKDGEDRIIALDARDRDTRRGLLEEAIEEAKKRVEYLSQRETLQTHQVGLLKAEVERQQDLFERGLVSRSNLSDSERLATEEESDLLFVREQSSAAIVQAATLQSDLSSFDADRERTLRTEGQTHLNDIKKIASERASIEDRMQLLKQWMNAASGLDTEVLIDYRVRRRTEVGVETETIAAYDELLPGDMLVIVIKSPEALQVSE